ncbi:hypothetical protein KIN20_037406 [Parelaphostrongylus tenuis]|uniref:EDRF1 N-terminal domain-containing protein n=1 Tax=Parelaphostrongylus tenuis TaxID=148309 RepID=A0AAD5REJ5_PARTN|nr:hypothetical protein KIN20_037406 [Parelaphostrongylus tenuis]
MPGLLLELISSIKNRRYAESHGERRAIVVGAHVAQWLAVPYVVHKVDATTLKQLLIFPAMETALRTYDNAVIGGIAETLPTKISLTVRQAATLLKSSSQRAIAGLFDTEELPPCGGAVILQVLFLAAATTESVILSLTLMLLRDRKEQEVLVKEEIPHILGSEFDPVHLKNITTNIISFLSKNMTQQGSTYWLLREKGSSHMNLFNLTNMRCGLTLSPSHNPFIIPVVTLLYRLTCDLIKKTPQNRPHKISNLIYCLLCAAAKLAENESLAEIKACIHYSLAGVYLMYGLCEDSSPSDHHSNLLERLDHAITNSSCQETTSTIQVDRLKTSSVHHEIRDDIQLSNASSLRPPSVKLQAECGEQALEHCLQVHKLFKHNYFHETFCILLKQNPDPHQHVTYPPSLPMNPPSSIFSRVGVSAMTLGEFYVAFAGGELPEDESEDIGANAEQALKFLQDAKRLYNLSFTILNLSKGHDELQCEYVVRLNHVIAMTSEYNISIHGKEATDNAIRNIVEERPDMSPRVLVGFGVLAHLINSTYLSVHPYNEGQRRRRCNTATLDISDESKGMCC